jgi:5'-methylthioadenosine phosphorylase
MTAVPEATLGLIGGSATVLCSLPEEVGDPDVEVLERDLVFETPFGATAPFKLLGIRANSTADGSLRRVLYVPYHGWRGAEGHRKDLGYSESIFWVFQQAGVRQILVDGTVGSVNPLLEVGDVVIPHDFIDFRTHTSTAFTSGRLVRMKEPTCTHLRAVLLQAALDGGFTRVFRKGIYGVAEGPRFESVTEIDHMRRIGVDIVGMSLAPEVYLARALRICYAGLYIPGNFAEGVNEDWETQDYWDVCQQIARPTARVMFAALKRASAQPDCRCASYTQILPPEWHRNMKAASAT